jgi:CheY-like chemotaxis protein
MREPLAIDPATNVLSVTTPLILIVDDDDDLRALLHETLVDHGFSVIEAPNGRDALDAISGEGVDKPALVLLDMDMPVMSGWEFLTVAKARDRVRDIPVIVISGDAPPKEVLASGTIVASMRKPFDPDKLIALVRKHARPAAASP